MNEHTLFGLIGWFFTEYIYRPHRHDWQFDRIIDTHVEVMGLTADQQEIIYKCSNCSAIIKVK